MKHFMKAVWQLCSYLFVPQRRAKDIETWNSLTTAV